MEKIKKDLKELSALNDNALFHFSFKSIGNIEALKLIELLKKTYKNQNILIPTHTWDRVNKLGLTYDSSNFNDVCIGIIPKLWAQDREIQRSLHPTHSVGAYGKDALWYIENTDVLTPCAIESPYHRLLEKKGMIFLVGVDFSKNTFIHGIEEWVSLTKRLSEPYEVFLKNEKKKVLVKFHENSSSNPYVWIQDECLALGICLKKTLGNAEVLCVDTQKLYNFLKIRLYHNPRFFDYESIKKESN